MSDGAFPSLHDWSLVGVEYDWLSATIRMRFKSAAGLQTLVATGVSDLHVPHTEPWGPSISVNGVEWLDGEIAGLRVLKIEMQSGDVIALTAETFELH
jgi:hypothetical protein